MANVAVIGAGAMGLATAYFLLKAGHEVTVQPGDTLWEIAEDELGEGERYPEIVAATGTETMSFKSGLKAL